MVRVFLNVGYYIFTDVSPTHPKQYTQATSTMWGVIVSTGTRGRYLYSPRDGSLAMLLLRAGRASSQVSEGQRSLIGPLYSAPNDDERYELFGLLGAYDTNCVGKVGVSKCECMCLR